MCVYVYVYLCVCVCMCLYTIFMSPYQGFLSFYLSLSICMNKSGFSLCKSLYITNTST